MSKVSITKSKLDNLANAVAAKSGIPVLLSVDEMTDAVLGISVGEENVLEGVKVNGIELPITNKKVNIPVASGNNAGVITAQMYSDLNNLSDVAFSGSYLDLSNTPVIGNDIVSGGNYFVMLANSSGVNVSEYINHYFNYSMNNTTAQLILGGLGPSQSGTRKGGLRLFDDTYYITVEPTTLTSNKTITFPNASGTIALTSDIIDEKLKVNSSSNTGMYYPVLTTDTTDASTKIRDTFFSYQITDTNIRLYVGGFANTRNLRGQIYLGGGTNYYTIIKSSHSGSSKTITLPNQTGTVALISDIPDVSGFITTETDPTVPAWAKAASKPTYTFSELTTHPTSVSGYGITDAYTKSEVDSKVSAVLKYKGVKATIGDLPLTGNTTGDTWHVTATSGEYAWDGTEWQELGTAISIPANTGSSTTGISIANHSTDSIYGVSSSTTSVYGVSTSTTTASKVTVGSSQTDYGVTAAGSGSASLTFTMDTTDTKKLKISFTHTHTAPTLGSKVPTVSASDVTVPIKNADATTVPIKNAGATTVVTSATHSVTDTGHTHTI